MIKKTLQFALVLWMLGILNISCDKDNGKADAYGNFEATETIISSETNGKITNFFVTEGQVLEVGQLVAQIDTVALSLKRDNLQAAKSVIYSKSKGVLSQIQVLETQISTAKKNKKRIQDLLADKLSSQKQLDDVNGQILAYQKQIKSIETQNAGVVQEAKTLDTQIKEIEHQIAKSTVKNPIKGTVLTKYAEANEITTFGKPLYKIANLDKMTFKGYISENQLVNIKIGDTVGVSVDAGDGLKSYDGTVTWIASEAEFTPKIIQTKEERINLVYAIKVFVQNDGGLKIGMPAEMIINHEYSSK
jgi:HlyD family secretion protein